MDVDARAQRAMSLADLCIVARYRGRSE